MAGDQKLTYDIPGGTATFRAMDELTQRQQRALARAGRRVNKAMIDAAKLTVDGKPDGEQDDAPELDMIGLPVDLSQDDVDAAWTFGDTIILTRLASWTRKEPIPADVDALLDLPSSLYTALQNAVAELTEDEKDEPDQFGPDGFPDPASPTGA